MMSPAIDREEFLQFLETLLLTHSPSGHEEEMDAALTPVWREYADEAYQDGFGNLIAVRRGETRGRPLALVTHKDELGMIVKRMLPDGRLKLVSTSSAQPWIYGEGPVDVLGEKEIVEGVLSFGSRHVSAESRGVHAGKDGQLPGWPQVWVSTGRSEAELRRLGVDVGTPAVIGRRRKSPARIADCIGGYGLDCKGALAILREVMKATQGRKLKRDLYFIAAAREEEGALGGKFAARELGVFHVVAVEIAPAAEEYQTRNDERPVLLYKDGVCLYSEAGNRQLLAAALDAGVEMQRAVLSSFGSDASLPMKSGFVARSNCLCFPTENTHGYELACVSAMLNTARVLIRFIERECAQ